MSENSTFNQEGKTNINGDNSRLSSKDLSNLLLSQFQGQKLSKTRILQLLRTKGHDVDNHFLIETLETLIEENKISKESAVHTSSGTSYTLWSFNTKNNN